MVRTSGTQTFTKLRQEHLIYILTEEDIRGYPIPQYYVEVGKCQNTNTALFMISDAYLKMYASCKFVCLKHVYVTGQIWFQFCFDLIKVDSQYYYSLCFLALMYE